MERGHAHDALLPRRALSCFALAAVTITHTVTATLCICRSFPSRLCFAFCLYRIQVHCRSPRLKNLSVPHYPHRRCPAINTCKIRKIILSGMTAANFTPRTQTATPQPWIRTASDQASLRSLTVSLPGGRSTHHIPNQTLALALLSPPPPNAVDAAHVHPEPTHESTNHRRI